MVCIVIININNYKRYKNKMTQEEYYKAPPDEIFNDIKENAIKVWNMMDNTYGYVTEKIDRIKNIQNVQDNAWYMVAMFDWENKGRLLELVRPDTASMIRDAMSEN